MKRLIKLAEKIKNVELRKKTIGILKTPNLSNKLFEYKAADFSKIPAWPVGAHHQYTGGELEHTEAVTEISIFLAELFKEKYKTEINMDYLIAGALLHDISKIFITKKSGSKWEFSGSKMDHAHLSACELYARGFPEEVVHIVAAHGGDGGEEKADPRTLEAVIVLKADVLDATIESVINKETETEEKNVENQIKLILGLGKSKTTQ